MLMYKVAGSPWAPEISSSLFFPAFKNGREGLELRVKNKFRSPFDQKMPSGVKKLSHISTFFHIAYCRT